MPVDYRLLTSMDQPTLWNMLMVAAHESTLESVKQLPELCRYVHAWGKTGDCGYGAFVSDRAVGAAWVRQFIGVDPGYGYVADDIPELAIAVLPKFQGQGIGTQLLQLLMEQVKHSYPGISLSVRSNNPAIALYQRLKFQRIEATDVTNRTGGESFTMVHYF